MKLFSLFRRYVNTLLDKRTLKRFYDYDRKVFLKNSACLGIFNQCQLLANITAREHVLEKGLTMPNMRYGFGRDNLLQLIDEIVKYKELGYDINNPLYVQAIRDIVEYRSVHEQNFYKLDDELKKAIDKMLSNNNFDCFTAQKDFSRESFFDCTEKDFLSFAHSRHTCRSYSGSVPLDILRSAIELASTAPSACNRQPVRIKIIDSASLKDKILSIQRGNRGFGEQADKLIIITSDVSVYNGLYERNCAFVDGGIFLMNVLYALHYYKIGACVLNWSATIEEDLKLHELLGIPSAEIIVAILTCGIPRDNFKVALSKRLRVEDILTIYK